MATALTTILDQFRDDACNNPDLGGRFERLILAYLQLDPLYVDRFSNVWMVFKVKFDVIQLINGVPAVQIELKTLGITPRRATEQIVEYKIDREMLCNKQRRTSDVRFSRAG